MRIDDGAAHRARARLPFLDRRAIAALARQRKFGKQAGLVAHDWPAEPGRHDEAARLHQGHGLRVVQGCEPGLAGRRGVQHHGLAHIGVVTQAGERALGLGDPDQRIVFHQREAHQFAGARGQSVQGRLANVRDSGGREKAKADGCQFHRHAIALAVLILHRQPPPHQDGKQPVHGALWQFQSPCDLADRQPLGVVGQQREDVQHALDHVASGHENLHVFRTWFQCSTSTQPIIEGYPA
ncbi:hypothetical protein D3C71_1383210 [compost metagenome]